MKRFFCLTIVLLSAIGIFGQEEGKTIEKSEFDAALRNRFLKFAGQSYRQTTSAVQIPIETYKNKISWKSVIEFTASPASRLLYEFDSPSIKTRTETIRIDGKTYVRKDGGEWTLKSPESGKSNAAERKFIIAGEETEYKSLGAQVLDKLNTAVYAKIEKKRLNYEKDKIEIFSSVAIKYWLDEDGGIIKEETVTENRIKSERNPSGSVFRSLQTTIWEFDPNIKIEAPIVAKQF